MAPPLLFEPLPSDISPRDILEQDFPRLRGKLPISGGWGYTQADACVIDRNDPCVVPGIPFDGVGVEYLFAEYRTYEELIVWREPGERYSGVRRYLERQSLVRWEDRAFDHLVFTVTALPEGDFERLKAAMEAGVGDPAFDAKAHMAAHAERLCTARVEYWFDITSFFFFGRR